MSKFTKRLTGMFALLCAAVMAAVGYFSEALPDSYLVSGEGMPVINGIISFSPAADEVAAPAAAVGENVQEAEIKLLGVIPIKKAELKRTEAPVLIPGGMPIGIKLLTDGIIVVSTQEKGPADGAGIEAGDEIISANGERLNSSNRLAEIIMNSHGEEISMTIRRDDRELQVDVLPQFSDAEGTYKAGLWIKDSSAGVGTMTYIDPQTSSFGALGHPISDSGTKKILPLGSGEIVDVTITGCDKGSAGCPGELFGTFLSGLASGNIEKNCEQGIFGKLNYVGTMSSPIPIAFKTDIKPGPATILTTVNGNTPKEYSIEIEKISLSSQDTKNMVIRVTDPELLNITGGIVQGMSGSPIIQDGKIAGAVTHVFISDPQRGYAIFIERMLEEAGYRFGK